MILPSILSEASSLVAKRENKGEGRNREKVDINDDLRKDTRRGRPNRKRKFKCRGEEKYVRQGKEHSVYY